MHIFRNTHRFQKESARFSNTQKSMKTSQNMTKQPQSSTYNKSLRCKYCYRPGHTDTNCRQKAMKRPPSMPEWISKAECKKRKRRDIYLLTALKNTITNHLNIKMRLGTAS